MAKKSAVNLGKKLPTKKQASSAQPTDDESISSSGSETGWNSDEDHVFVNLNKGDKNRYYDEEEEDYDDEEDGGVLLSDILTKNLTKAAKKAEKDKKKQQKGQEDSEDDKVVKKDKKPAKKLQPEPDSDDEPEEEYDEDDSEEDDDEEEDDDSELEDDDEDMDELEDEDEDDLEDDDMDEEDDDEDEDEDDDDDDEEMDVDVEEDEDEDEDEDEEKHTKLMKAISRFSDVHEQQEKQNKVGIRSQMMPETSMMHDEGLTMSALLGSIQDSKGISAVKASLEQLDKTKAAPKYVEKVIANRMERKETYQGTKAEMDKWHETVLTNRNLPTLDLANDKRQIPRVKDIVTKFQPKTALEKEIQMIMVQSGTTEEAIEKKEIDSLQARNISLEEIKERQAELAKVNALMFYEQMKRHRINKIKSKAYRAIKRKQKRREQGKDKEGEEVELAEESSGDDNEELEEKNAYDRVKERMDLKHKNTSKWARMALAHGHTDQSLRTAYHESVRLGQELSKKMNEKVNQRNNEDDDGGDYENDESLVDQAKAEFREAFDEEDASGSIAVKGKYKKLFEMDFMKKATEQQKQRAREEAQQVLKEIAAMERGDDGEDEQDSMLTFQTSKKVDQKQKQAAKESISSLFAANGGNGFQLNIGKGTTVSTQAPNTNMELEDNSTHEQKIEQVVEVPVTATTGKKNKKNKKESEAEVSNPWLDLTGASGNSTGKQRGSHQLGVKNKNLVDGNQVLISVNTPSAGSIVENKQQKNSKIVSNNSTKLPSDEKPTDNSKPNTSSNQKNLLSNKTQDDLVKMAFAGPDLEAEFMQYKEQEIDRELGIDEKRSKILKDVKAGWGDWAGPGGMEVSKKILDKRDRLMMQVQKESETKKLDRKDNKMSSVMISERRITNNSKYKVAEVPYPFRSREEYERSLQMPVGEEWNASNAVTKLTQPEIKKRSGRIIEPIKLEKRAHSKDNSNSSSSKKQKTK